MSTDARTILAVVLLLGAVTLVGLSGLIYLAASGGDAVLLAVVAGPTSAALGALGSVLATTRTVDENAVAREAREEALAEVRSLET